MEKVSRADISRTFLDSWFSFLDCLQCLSSSHSDRLVRVCVTQWGCTSCGKYMAVTSPRNSQKLHTLWAYHCCIYCLDNMKWRAVQSPQISKEDNQCQSVSEAWRQRHVYTLSISPVRDWSINSRSLENLAQYYYSQEGKCIWQTLGRDRSPRTLVHQIHSLTKNTANGSVGANPPGWPRVCGFLDSDPNFMIYRRFGYARTSLLTYYQDIIREYEEKLDDLDMDDYKNEDTRRAICSRNGDDERRPAVRRGLFLGLNKELKTYGPKALHATFLSELMMCRWSPPQIG